MKLELLRPGEGLGRASVSRCQTESEGSAKVAATEWLRDREPSPETTAVRVLSAGGRRGARRGGVKAWLVLWRVPGPPTPPPPALLCAAGLWVGAPLQPAPARGHSAALPDSQPCDSPLPRGRRGEVGGTGAPSPAGLLRGSHSLFFFHWKGGPRGFRAEEPKGGCDPRRDWVGRPGPLTVLPGARSDPFHARTRRVPTSPGRRACVPCREARIPRAARHGSS